jgi:hypothetical protein
MSRDREYEYGTVSVEKLRSEIETFWQELPNSAELRQEVSEAGIEPAQVQELDPVTDIEITKEGEGFDPVTVTIVVAFAPAGVHILNSLWDEVIVPWIRRRGGGGAIGREKARK